MDEVGEIAGREGVAVGFALDGVEVAAVDGVAVAEGFPAAESARGNERIESEGEPLRD